MSDRSCGQIMEPFLQTVAERTDLPPLQIIGGNGSAALLHEDSVIDFASRTIEAPASCDLPRYRPDRSLRDMDTLVLSSDADQIGRIQAVAEDLIGNELKTSIFGLKSLDDLKRQEREPLRSTARVFLGDRYVECAYDEVGNLISANGYKSVFPFKAPIGVETLETFELSIAGLPPMPTAHPGATILNYLTRSISGLRAKDVDKVTQICQRVVSNHPEIRTWIRDGPGRQTLDLARVIHTLREPREDPRTLELGELLHIEPFDLTDLEHHDSFMAPHLRPDRQRRLVEVAHRKARLLARFEASPAIVSFWQKHIEDRIHRIVHNDT